MKPLFRFLSLLLLVGFITVEAQQSTNWQWLHPQPQGNQIRFVKAWDANNWYLMAFSGTFMKTTDGGATWFFHHRAGFPNVLGYTGNIYDAHFFDMNNGVAVGAAGITRTSNGGVTWDTVAGLPTAATWYQVFFENNLVGYATGTSSGRMAKTTDGGATWTLNTVLPSASYYDVYAKGDTVIVATTTGNIRRSTDAGATWTQISTGATMTPYRMLFTSPEVGYYVGTSGYARKTTDNGLTWTALAPNAGTTTTFYDVDYVNNTLFLSGNSFSVYKSTDQGATFDTLGFLDVVANQPWTSTQYAADFLSTTDFVTGGGFGLVNSRFGANHPRVHTRLAKPGSHYDVWAESPTGKVIVVGAPTVANSTYDQIQVSSNGGMTWNQGNIASRPNSIMATRPVFIEETEFREESKDNPVELSITSSSTLRAVDMANSIIGLAVGSNGAIYKTMSSGFVWDSLTTVGLPATQTLYDVDFVDDTLVFVVNNTGDTAGTVLKSTDAGLSWTKNKIKISATANDHRLYAISMFDANNGWVVNYTPKPYRTTDGGLTWTEQALSDGFTGFLYDVHAVSANIAWCVGSSGRVYRTVDGGTNWVLTATPAGTTAFQTVYAHDSNTVMIAGGSGVVLQTRDAGVTWTLENTAGATIQGIHPIMSIPTLSIDSVAVFAAGLNSYVHKSGKFYIPVELASFSAAVSGNTVTLSWNTGTESNNRGFEIQRSSNNREWLTLGFITGSGTSVAPKNYSYTDFDLKSGNYYYRLRQIDMDGTSKLYSLNSVIQIGTPASFALNQNYPNPFNPSTTISYSIPKSDVVTLKIYNILGSEVATLVNGYQEAGSYTLTVSTSEMQSLSSGVYFYTLTNGGNTLTRKMTLLK
mgnify:CR=1 FL=1